MAFKLTVVVRCIGIVILGLWLSGMAKSPPLKDGQAPQFELKTVGGKIFKSDDFKGKFIILNFWATWCVPCIKELPEFQKTHQSLKNNNVEIIAINLAEPGKRVDKYLHDNHLTFTVLLDSFGNVSAKYRVIGLPVTFFITPDGIIRDKIFGGGLTQEILESRIKRFSLLYFQRGKNSPA